MEGELDSLRDRYSAASEELETTNNDRVHLTEQVSHCVTTVDRCCRRRCHVMTANGQTGSAQRRGRRAGAWSGTSLVRTHWPPAILTGQCLDQAPWLRRLKLGSGPSTACTRRRTTSSQSPSRHWARWERKRRNLSATSAVGLPPQPGSRVPWLSSSSALVSPSSVATPLS